MSQTHTSLHTKYTADRQGPVRNLGTYSNVINDRRLYDILFNSSEMNFVDKAAYPDVAEMEQQTVSYLVDRMHGNEDCVGFATTGSSEAIILALAWHRKAFMAKHPELADQPLNFLVNEGYHKAFDKFASLFGTELRTIPLGKDLKADIASVESLIDERTFCIVGIAGSTEIGMVDDVTHLATIAAKHELPVHVDAAIGGYVLPYTEQTVDAWDFELPAVKSINVSAHKYGLCLPGIGFLLVRNNTIIPADYSGDIAYLAGGGITDNALTCSRNAAFVINAHYNVSSIGIGGYTRITRQNFDVARYLSDALRDIPGITYVNNGDVPVVLFSGDHILGLSDHLSAKGWIQSAHTIRVIGKRCIRVVIRKHITRLVVDELLDDIRDFRTAPIVTNELQLAS